MSLGEAVSPLSPLQELQADLERQRRVLYNAAVLQARDQDERARISAASAPSVAEDSPFPTPENIPTVQRDENSQSVGAPEPPTHSSRPIDRPRQTPRPSPDPELPPVGKDRDWQPEAWTPQTTLHQRNFLETLSTNPDVELRRLCQESARRVHLARQIAFLSLVLKSMSQTYVLKRRCATKPTKYLRISQQAVFDDECESPLTEEPYSLGHLSVVDTLDLREGLPEHDSTTSSSSAMSNFELPPGRILQLIHSEQVPRYTKDVKVQSFGRPRERTFFEIPPLTRTFPYVSKQTSFEQGSLKEDCAPWVPATHPDGALYFFDKDRRLFTDTDMLDPVLREEMEDFYHCLQRILGQEEVVIPSQNYDLTLDIMPSEDGRIRWSYYYACHETRCLFWLDPYDATYMISELHGVGSPPHLKHRLEDLFWNHWSLFPAFFEGRRLDRAAVDELNLSMDITDVMTSKSSTLPFDGDTMQKMLALVTNVKESDAGLVYHTAGVTRLLSFLAHWRFLYFHGQNSVRLERHKTVYAHPDREKTLLITLLSPALFFAPEGYLRLLEIVRVDGVIIESIWQRFVSRLLKEWEQLIISSTVMLSVNVGFLAVPGVVVSNLNSITGTKEVVIFTSPAQIASCMSIVASAGSIVIGLLLVRRSGPQQNQDSMGAASALAMRTHRIFGLEPLAVILSLPWALLMWS
ncbi:hypothetical protein EDB89DRAFT_2069372 [Lactarius sanguifluus]|nr:hypothetical protein EDB89DRAFT_2069372 [Lactarius sanguifluus]